MATRYIDDGGDNSDGLTWAKAYTSINSLITSEASFLTTGGNIVYFAHDMQCQATNSAALTIQGPSIAGSPVHFISVTNGTTTYQKGTGKQIDTTEGSYRLTFDGAFLLHGLHVAAGEDVNFTITTHLEMIVTEDLTIESGDDGQVRPGISRHKNLTIDLGADSVQRTSNPIDGTGNSLGGMDGVTFLNASLRSGETFYFIDRGFICGVDASSFTHASWGGLVDGGVNRTPLTLSNCKTPATWAPVGAGSPAGDGRVMIYNSGPADAPTYHYIKTRPGTLVSSSSISRTGGAEIESTATSWLIETTSLCTTGEYFYTEWIYGVVDATGSKNFDLFIVNDAGDFTDAEVQLEVQYLGTASEANWDLADDSTLSDDTTSTWSGSGPSYTYKQRLRLTATVNETGQYRARVLVKKTSIADTDYFYVDPLVTVS